MSLRFMWQKLVVVDLDSGCLLWSGAQVGPQPTGSQAAQLQGISAGCRKTVTSWAWAFPHLSQCAAVALPVNSGLEETACAPYPGGWHARIHRRTLDA